MDVARLITIVQEYEELYNLKHPNYSNQQRRDNIWEEIGNRLNENGKFLYFYFVTHTFARLPARTLFNCHSIDPAAELK